MAKGLEKEKAPRREDVVRKFPGLTGAENLENELPEIYRYVEEEAEHAIKWYMRNSVWKRRVSRYIRYSAIVLGGFAGLLPIISAIWPPTWWHVDIAREDFTLITALLIGMIALLRALDSLGYVSRGWMRYVLSAFEIRSSLKSQKGKPLVRPVRPEQL